MSAVLHFHVNTYVLTHWAVSSVVVTVDIQWMVQDVMVSDNIIVHIITDCLNDRYQRVC